MIRFFIKDDDMTSHAITHRVAYKVIDLIYEELEKTKDLELYKDVLKIAEKHLCDMYFFEGIPSGKEK